VAFPASSLARKGALEKAEALRHLGWRLLVLGTPPSDPRLWGGIDVTYALQGDPTWLARVDIVALPAYVEHAPRGLLAAIAHGIPVVASPACGLPRSLESIEVAPGEIPSLITALQQALHARLSAQS
jgi:glycosyltransferase involved in cell wall biosynthesis